jgi:hypothetical protein
VGINPWLAYLFLRASNLNHCFAPLKPDAHSSMRLSLLVNPLTRLNNPGQSRAGAYHGFRRGVLGLYLRGK